MRVSVGTVTPPGNPHVAAFREVVLTVEAALRDLGHTVVPPQQRAVGEPLILFGSHLVPSGRPLPTGTILYNLEQVSPDAPWLTPSVLDLARRHTVWDYSLENVAAWKARGIDAVHVPIGYHSVITNIPRRPEAEKTVDVLFYGSMNPRRAQVISALRDAGLAVNTAFGVYGAQRDALIERAKVVLNLHFYSAQVFEIVRCSHLLANHVPVVSETPVASEFADAIAWADYDGLVARCAALVADPVARDSLAQRGFDAIRAHPMMVALWRALGPHTG